MQPLFLKATTTKVSILNVDIYRQYLRNNFHFSGVAVQVTFVACAVQEDQLITDILQTLPDQALD